MTTERDTELEELRLLQQRTLAELEESRREVERLAALAAVGAAANAALRKGALQQSSEDLGFSDEAGAVYCEIIWLRQSLDYLKNKAQNATGETVEKLLRGLSEWEPVERLAKAYTFNKVMLPEPPPVTVQRVFWEKKDIETELEKTEAALAWASTTTLLGPRFHKKGYSGWDIRQILIREHFGTGQPSAPFADALPGEKP